MVGGEVTLCQYVSWKSFALFLLFFLVYLYRIERKSTRIDNISLFTSMTVVVRQPGGQILSPPYYFLFRSKVFVVFIFSLISPEIDRSVVSLRQFFLFYKFSVSISFGFKRQMSVVSLIELMVCLSVYLVCYLLPMSDVSESGWYQDII